jgi:hypothetical protein
MGLVSFTAPARFSARKVTVAGQSESDSRRVMMKRIQWTAVCLGAGLFVAGTCSVSPPATKAGDFPRVFKTTSVEKLARKIDDLQEDIDRNGTVVVKSPDVWGEARLTKHRAEYEALLEAEKGNFKETIQATLKRSDQAFLLQTLAMQAALGGRSATTVTPSGTTVNTSSTTVNADGERSTESSQETNSEEARAAQGIPGPVNVTNVETGFKQNDPDLTNAPIVSSTVDGQAQPGIALEPVLKLDQLSRYLNHLHQLRRINEGDDTADAPGYSMNLMRFPISILPGTNTREGYGAEVTMTITPCISDKLLESTFQTLVINDLLDTLTLPVMKLVGSDLKEAIAEKQKVSVDIAGLQQGINEESKTLIADGSLYRLRNERYDFGQFATQAMVAAAPITVPVLTEAEYKKAKVRWDALKTKAKENEKKIAERKKKLEELQKKLAEVTAHISNGTSLSTQSRFARYAVASTQFDEVFGIEELAEIVDAVENHVPDVKTRPLYHDVRSFLAEELDKSWKMLARTERTTSYRAWDTECPGLANAIRTEQDLAQRRAQFRLKLKGSSQLTGIFEALGWAILVDSALLDLQLRHDIERVAAESGSLHVPAAVPHFWGTQPGDSAVSLFRDYVASRWPIHVFAIDPVTQDQNVADSFSQRRELQLTLSVALASGQINAQQYMQFARRLETDLDTIALNRTVVGYSHGSDTFGWRFQPRIQTPPTDGNASVFFRDMLVGGASRDRAMQKQMLEAGSRECVAVVLMPSIVSQVNVDMRSSWFRLDKPHQRRFDLENSVELGRDVVELQSLCKECVKDQHKYRYGDVWRLSRAVEQLEKQLPLQNAIVSVPTENTLGGTQLFESGRTSLGPELIGFYGQPGVIQAVPDDGDDETPPAVNPSATLFLVGRNFSVTNTKVIAAGAPATAVILSRELLQITIPAVPADKVIERPDQSKIVDVHVATPYGVSHHLHIPVKVPAAKIAASKTATDVKAATKAIATVAADAAAHKEQAHPAEPVATKWKTDEKSVQGTLVFDKTGAGVSAFRFGNSATTPLALEVAKTLKLVPEAFGNPILAASELELAFWVVAHNKAGEIGKHHSDLLADASKVASYGSIENAVEAGLKGIAKLNPEAKPTELKLQAFVRKKKGSGAVFRVAGDELTVKLTVTDECPCPPAAGK